MSTPTTADAGSDSTTAFHSLVEETSATIRAARTDALADLVTTATEAARAAGMTVVPALLPVPVDAGATVLLDPDRTSVDEVIVAATASATTLLFVQAPTLDAATVREQLTGVDVPVVASMKGLLKEIRRVAGWTRSVDIAFAHHGVLVIWPATAPAPWSDAIDELLTAAHDTARRHIRTSTSSDSRERLDNAAIAALAAKLAGLPGFRRGRGPERETVARELPEIAALADNRHHRWEATFVVREADKLLTAEIDTTIADLAPRKQDLAAALAEDPGFQSIRTADARARFAQDWILDHTNGLRLPAWWAKELVAATKTLTRQLRL